MSAQYDNTNQISVFPSGLRGTVIGTGKVNVEGTEKQVIVVNDTMPSGKTVQRVYMEIGALFPVSSQHEKAPALSGPMLIPQTKATQISLWSRQGGKGPFLSGKISVQQERSDASPAAAPKGAELKDEIPF